MTKTTTIKNYEEARNIYGVGTKQVKKYINNPIHYYGTVFNSKEGPYWEPPQNFIWYKEFKTTLQAKMCKSIHKETKEVTYYNSLMEAALHIGLISNSKQDYKLLRDTINYQSGCQDVRVNTYNWVKLESCGTLVYPDGNRVSVEKVRNDDD